MPKTKNRAFGPKIRVVQKSEKGLFCGMKKCEKFRIRNPNKILSKNFHPTNAAEKALCTKRHFFTRNRAKKSRKKSQKFQNFAKLFFENKIGKSKSNKYFFSRRLRRSSSSSSFFFFVCVWSTCVVDNFCGGVDKFYVVG